MRRLNLMLFIIVIAIIIISLVRAVYGTLPNQGRPELKRGPAAGAQALGKRR